MTTGTHRPRKRFGQNFLHDPGIIQRIVDSIAPQADDELIEIGPGQGAITLPLLAAAGHLQAVELDRDLITPLADRAAGIGQLTIINRDALQVDFCALRTNEHKRLRLIGNLPYNISTPILFHLLAQQSCIRDMHFMLQKEVVDRMAAGPGNSSYGRLSVMVQLHCAVTPLFTIGPGAFRPPPKVDSAFVRLTPHATPPVEVEDPDAFARIVSAAFGQRRKTLRNALRELLSADDISAAGVDPGARAERIDLAGFAALAVQARRTGER